MRAPWHLLACLVISSFSRFIPFTRYRSLIASCIDSIVFAGLANSVVMKPISVISALFLLILSSCVSSPATSPIPYQFYANGSGPAEELVIFLPGRGDDLDAFEQAGFVERLFESDRAADAVAVRAHLGYYKGGLVAERIYHDILQPFQQKGYQRFTIVGTSLGGYGALWLNSEYPDLVTGMVLMAPYLGRKPLIKAIEGSGDVSLWRSQLGNEPGPDQPAELAWCWIDDLDNNPAGKIDRVILAFGEEDKFSRAGELLARSIPESRVFRTDGGHNWAAWYQLWSEITADEEWATLWK